MKVVGYIWALILLLLALIIITPMAESWSRNRRHRETVGSFKLWPEMATQVNAATSGILFEGLPHQQWESGELKTELEHKRTVTIQGFAYYAETQTLSTGDFEAIKGLYVAESTFSPYAGPKRCGGYHPDYLIEFRNGTNVIQVEFCLGCDESKTFQDGKTLHCDIHPKARNAILALLTRYQKNRPHSRLLELRETGK